MPIRPENRALYGLDWDTFARELKDGRAGGRCECDGRCGRGLAHLGSSGRCVEREGFRALHGAGAMEHWKPVVLTVAHLDHDPSTRDLARVMVMCAGCHLHYDIDHHRASRVLNEQREREAAGQLTLV